MKTRNFVSYGVIEKGILNQQFPICVFAIKHWKTEQVLTIRSKLIIRFLTNSKISDIEQ